jgi:hypothetical protein
MTKIWDEATAPSLAGNGLAGNERPVRIVTVPDRFLSKFWAILTSVILHPFTTTIVRVTRSDDDGAA